jgi:hypothetical protein
LDDRLGLLGELRAARCTVSIVTTYSVDFHFYEAVVLRKLNAAGCEHHVLLVDAERCGEALADPDRRPRLAGISYTLLPISRVGAFHPKLVLLAGKKSSRLFVGSHNVTFAGFGGNAEVTSVVGGGRAVHGAALVDALAAIRMWAGDVPTTLPNEVFDLAGSLLGTARHAGTGDVSFLYSGTGQRPLWDQLRPLLPEKPRRVVVVGPFFDAGMQFVRRAMSDLTGAEFVVAVDPTYSDISSHAARTTGARFVDARACLGRLGFADSSALHAKMMLVEGDGRDLLVAGSANPSSAAWLRIDANAEAVLVRRDVPNEDLKRLGLRDLAEAPEITATQWAEVDARRREDADAQPSIGVARALAAVEEHGRITIYGVRERPTGVRLLLSDGSSQETDAFLLDGGILVMAESAHDLSTCNLVELLGDAPAFATVNHAQLLSTRGGGASTRGGLSAALGAVTDDPSRIEEVLKIVERAIEDVDGSEGGRGAGASAEGAVTKEDAGLLGSRAIKLDDVQRRHGRPNSLATGDVGVVIDLLIRRIAEGLPSGGVSPLPPEIEEGELDPLEEAARSAHVTVGSDALVKACHRKVRRMVHRMVDRLAHVMETKAGAARAAIQLAAVLGVLRWLRRIERQLAWLPLGASLIPNDAREHLFWWGAMHLGVSRPSFGALVTSETGEAPEELAFVTGLVAWLGREAQIDARSRTLHHDEDEAEELPWAGLLVMLMRLVSPDEHATTAFRAAVAEGRALDREAWIADHLRMGETVALAESSEAAPTTRGKVQRGDVVRIDMPKGVVGVGFVVGLDDAKVRLLDAEEEHGRAVMKTYVRSVGIGVRLSKW